MSEFRFCSISWEEWMDFDQILHVQMILMTSNLGLLSVRFRQFITELRPLNDVRILFPFNILNE